MKVRKKPDFGLLVCEDCGTEEQKRGFVQRFCRSCSVKRDMVRKKKHHLAKGKARYEERRTQFGERGVALNLPQALCVNASTPPMPEMAWYRRVAVPFSWAGSKNHIWANTARGHVYMREESSFMRHNLTKKIVDAVEGVKIAQNKLWVDMFIQKPVARGDAVNFVDLVCDAVKDGLLLDDRWFSLRQVDWQIVKTDPHIFVGVGQETVVDVQACSSCGRFLTFEKFQRNKARTNGIGLNCRECQATKAHSLKRDRAIEKFICDNGQGVFG